MEITLYKYPCLEAKIFFTDFLSMGSLVRGTHFICGIKSGKGKSVYMNILICGLNREEFSVALFYRHKIR